jgi:hypothetical protein
LRDFKNDLRIRARCLAQDIADEYAQAQDWNLKPDRGMRRRSIEERIMVIVEDAVHGPKVPS